MNGGDIVGVLIGLIVGVALGIVIGAYAGQDILKAVKNYKKK